MGNANSKDMSLKERLAKLSPAERQALLLQMADKKRAKAAAEQATPKQTTLAQTTLPKPKPKPKGNSAAPLSNGQKRLWMFEKFSEGNNAYNIVSALRLSGQVDLDGLRWAFQQLINRHEIFRTCFSDADIPTQVIHGSLDVELNMLPAADLDPVADPQGFESLLMSVTDVQFDLQQLPLFTVNCLPLADGSLVVMLVLHHMLADGWSLALIEADLTEFYQAYLQGQRQSAEAQAAQYADYVAWENTWMQSPEASAQLAYWQQQLAEAPELSTLPTRWDRGAGGDFASDSLVFSVPQDLFAQGKAFADNHQCSLFMLLLSVYKLTLAYLSGQEDWVIGTPVANRKNSRLHPIIGMLSNSVAIASHLTPEMTFAQFLQQVKSHSLQAFANQNLPFEQVVDALNLQRDASYSPLFQCLFALQATERSQLQLGASQIEPLQIPRRGIEFDMIFEIFTTDYRDNQFVLSYRTALYSKALVQQFKSTFCEVLSRAIAEPEQLCQQLFNEMAPQSSHMYSGGTSSQTSPSLPNVEQPVVLASLQTLCQQAAIPSELALKWQTLLAQKPVLSWRASADLLAQQLQLVSQHLLVIDSAVAPELSLLVAYIATQHHCDFRVVKREQVCATAAQYAGKSVFILPPAGLAQIASECAAEQVHCCLVNGHQPEQALLASRIPVVLCWSMSEQLPTVVVSYRQGECSTRYTGELSIRNSRGQVLPKHSVGELWVGPEQAQKPTALKAILEADQLVVLGYLHSTATAVNNPWGNGIWRDSAVITRQILALPGIQDVQLLSRTDQGGIQRLVAYLVSERAPDPQLLMARIETALNPEDLPDAIAVVNHIPYTSRGEVDVAALESIPTFSQSFLGQLKNQSALRLLAQESQSNPLDLPESLLALVRDPSQQPAEDPQPEVSQAPPSLMTGEPLNTDALPDNLSQLLLRAADTDADITYILNEQGDTLTVTYRELAQQARCIAQGLSSAGLKGGDRVVLQVAANADIVAAFWGGQFAGVSVLPVACPDEFTSDNKDWQKVQSSCQNLDIAAVICDPEQQSWLQAQLPMLKVLPLAQLSQAEAIPQVYNADSDDVALLLLTSGSTSAPKAVQQRHGALIARSAATQKVGQFDPSCISFNWMPLDHVGGIVMYHILDVFMQARQVHCPTDLILAQPSKWLDYLSQYQVVSTWAPNFAYALLTDHLGQLDAATLAAKSWDLTALRFILNGGEAVVAKTARHFMQTLAPYGLKADAMFPSWGMSETCSGVTFNSQFNPITDPCGSFVSVGKAVPGVSIRLLDSEGKVVPQGHTGQLQIQGPSITLGYLNNPEETQAAFTDDGWFVTGDLARMDGEGITITGRAKDLIIVNGINCQAQDIEQVIETVPGVAGSGIAVCAVRSGGDNTEKVAVFFTPDDSITNDETALIVLKNAIQAACLKQLRIACHYVVPLDVEEFPRTSIGKIQRAKLRDKFNLGEFNARVLDTDMGEGEQQLPPWFFQTTWQKVAADNGSAAGQNVLLLGTSEQANNPEISALLATLLTTCGQVVQARPSSDYGCPELQANESQLIPTWAFDYQAEAHWRKVFTQLSNDTGDTTRKGEQQAGWRIVYWVDAGEVAELPAGLATLMAFAQAWQSADGAAVNGLDVVTENAFAATDANLDALLDAPLNAELGAVHGFISSLNQEIPELPCRQIDLQQRGHDPQTLNALARELVSNKPQSPVVLAGSSRYQQQLSALSSTLTQAQDYRFARDKFVLITGGLGGIGQCIASALLTQDKVNVLLVGRSQLKPDMANWQGFLQLQAQAQNAGVKVAYVALDITQPEALKHAVADYEQQWQQPLGSLLHLAAALNTALIKDEHSSVMSHSFKAKVQGAIAMALNPEGALWQRRDVQQIFFGSVNGVFGGTAYGTYSAANSYLESICRQLVQDGYRAQCIHWSMWEELGLSKDLAIKEQTRAKGYHLLSPEQGVLSLRLAAFSDVVCPIVGVDGENPFMAHRVGQPLQSALLLSNGDSQEEPQVPSDIFGTDYPYQRTTGEQDTKDDSLRFVLAESEQDSLQGKLAAVWCQVLGLPEIDCGANFFTLGGDSILAIQVVAKAREAGIELQPKQLFESQSLVQLSEVAKPLGAGQKAAEFIVGDVPLAAIQSWFASLQLIDAHHMNQSALLRFAQAPEPEKLQQALQRLVRHHDMLRCQFYSDGSQVQARIGEAYQLTLETLNLPASEASYEVRLQTACSELQSQLTLEQGLLLKVVLINDETTQQQRLLLVVHHLVTDGVSWRLILDDLTLIYQSLLEHNKPLLPYKTDSYQAWTQAWQQHLEVTDLSDSVEFYVQQAQAASARTQREWGTHQDAISLELSLSEAASSALVDQLPGKTQLHINELLITALLQAYSQWSRQQGLYLLMEGHGRNEIPEFHGEQPDISHTLGWFTSLYPVWLAKPQQGGLVEDLQAVSRSLSALPDEGVTFNWLRYCAQPDVQTQLQALKMPEISFNYLGKFDAQSDGLIAFAKESPGDHCSPNQQRINGLDIVGAMVEGRLSFSLIFTEKFAAKGDMAHLADGFKSALENMANAMDTLPTFTRPVVPKLLHFSDGEARKSAKQLLDHLSRQTPTQTPQFLLPATFTQVGLLYEGMASQTKGMYVSQLINQLSGDLVVSALQDAWQYIVHRHAIYRTAFHTTAQGTMVQVVMPTASIPWTERDLRGLPEAQQEAQFNAWVKQDSEQAFDISQAPLLRILLVRFSDTCYRMLMSEHHAVSDGWSRGLILRELTQRYLTTTAGAQGAESLRSDALTAADTAPPFAHYSRWLAAQNPEAMMAYWRSALADCQPCKPLLGQTPVEQVTESCRYALDFDAQLSDQLSEFARAHQLTPNSIAQFVWGLTLSLYTGQEDVLYATTLSGRPADLAQVEHIAGPFIATMPVRQVVDSDTPVLQQLQNKQTQLMQVTENGYVPLNEVLQLIADEERENPPVNTLFVYENFPVSAPQTDAATSLNVDWVRHTDKSEFPLAVMLVPAQCLQWVAYYQSGVLQEETVAQLTAHYQLILQRVLASPEAPLPSTELLPAEAMSGIVNGLQARDAAQQQALLEQAEQAAAEAAEDASQRIETFEF